MTDSEKFRVLIVDDNADNLTVVASTLATRGFALTLARSGLEALASAGRNTPDLILLDIIMPELDGFETCRRLKNLPGCRDVPVIFLTAHSDQEYILEGFKAGGSDFISKPFNHEELFHRVEAHARLCRLQAQLKQRNEAMVAEAELRARREMQLSVSEKARLAGRIAAGISHHFNNMFHSVLGHCELIAAATAADSEVHGYAQRIVEAISSTRKIVDQLAHYPGSAAASDNSVISLSEIFQEIAVAFAGILPANIKLTSGISANCPDISLKRADTVQALTNLVMNSIEAISGEGGQIKLHATMVSGRDYLAALPRIDPEAMFVEISVADNGIGMETSVLEKACEPFFTTSTGIAGKNGLGLAFVQGFMHASDGFLRIDSKIGDGTLVRLLFPISAGV